MAEIPPDALSLGLARIARIAFSHGDLDSVFGALVARLEVSSSDAAAMIDLATILEIKGEAEAGAQMRRDALRLRRSYATRHGDGSGPVLLALVAPGGFLANTPIDFLLDGSDATIWLHHIDEATTDLDNLPRHDAAIVAVGEGPDQRALVARLAPLLATLPGPILNGVPDRIAALARDRAAAALADIPGLHCPPVVRAGRETLVALAAGGAPEAIHPGLCWPLVIRPEGSHAGAGLEKLADAGHLAELLADQPQTAAFYLAPFIEYRGRNGLYAKSRVVMIGGQPYPVHHAISPEWIVHYLSAGMENDPAKRAAESAWFAGFKTGFARRHGAALAEMQARIGLDYWGMDCAELADGRLLLFEADTALIVHDLDDPEVFAYKSPAMRRLFAAFLRLVTEKSGLGQKSAEFCIHDEPNRARLGSRH